MFDCSHVNNCRRAGTIWHTVGSTERHFLLPRPWIFVPLQWKHSDHKFTSLSHTVITELQRRPTEKCSLYNKPLCSAGSAATSTCASVPLSPTRDPWARTETCVASGPGHENPTYLHWEQNNKCWTHQQSFVYNCTPTCLKCPNSLVKRPK